MLRRLVDALTDYAGLALPIQTGLLNDALGDCARALGLGRLAVVAENVVLANVRGTLRAGAHDAPPGVALGKQSFRLDMRVLTVDGDGYAQVERILRNYDMDGDGAYVWFLPDGYMASLSSVEKVWAQHGGGYFSHESICVLNSADRSTRCRLDIYYEDASRPCASAEFAVRPKQSLHYRLDKLTADDGAPLIAKDAPVSYRVTSFDTRVVVQGSRILTSGRSSEFASFGTTMAWTPLL
jgi:hypothetical protein